MHSLLFFFFFFRPRQNLRHICPIFHSRDDTSAFEGSFEQTSAAEVKFTGSSCSSLPASEIPSSPTNQSAHASAHRASSIHQIGSFFREYFYRNIIPSNRAQSYIVSATYDVRDGTADLLSSKCGITRHLSARLKETNCLGKWAYQLLSLLP